MNGKSTQSYAWLVLCLPKKILDLLYGLFLRSPIIRGPFHGTRNNAVLLFCFFSGPYWHYYMGWILFSETKACKFLYQGYVKPLTNKRCFFFKKRHLGMIKPRKINHNVKMIAQLKNIIHPFLLLLMIGFPSSFQLDYLGQVKKREKEKKELLQNCFCLILCWAGDVLFSD